MVVEPAKPETHTFSSIPERDQYTWIWKKATHSNHISNALNIKDHIATIMEKFEAVVVELWVVGRIVCANLVPEEEKGHQLGVSAFLAPTPPISTTCALRTHGTRDHCAESKNTSAPPERCVSRQT